MADRKTIRTNASNDVLRLIIDKGYARNTTEAINIYKALERAGGGDAVGKQAYINISNGKHNGGTIANRVYKELKSLGLTDDQITGLTNDVASQMTTSGIFNLVDYNRLGLGDNPVDLNQYFENDGIEQNARENAFTSYYRDIMDYNDPNTTAGRTYDTMLEQERNAALDQMALTDMSAQQANLQQAAVVKQIADQVRNERMARLRAGMSESQIAQQDMANMMANMQAINDNAAAMNQARLNARSAYNNASQTALDKYMNTLQATGNIATGMAAADTSNPIIMGKQYAGLSNKDKKGVKDVTGQK